MNIKFSPEVLIPIWGKRSGSRFSQNGPQIKYISIDILFFPEQINAKLNDREIFVPLKTLPTELNFLPWSKTGS